MTLSSLPLHRYMYCQLYAPAALRIALEALRKRYSIPLIDDMLTPDHRTLLTTGVDDWLRNMLSTFEQMKTRNYAYPHRGRDAFMLFAFSNDYGHLVVSASFRIDDPAQVNVKGEMTFRLLEVIERGIYNKGKPGTLAWWKEVLNNPQSSLLPQKDLRTPPVRNNFHLLDTQTGVMSYRYRNDSHIKML